MLCISLPPSLSYTEPDSQMKVWLCETKLFTLLILPLVLVVLTSLGLQGIDCALLVPWTPFPKASVFHSIFCFRLLGLADPCLKQSDY